MIFNGELLVCDRWLSMREVATNQHDNCINCVVESFRNEIFVDKDGRRFKDIIIQSSINELWSFYGDNEVTHFDGSII